MESLQRPSLRASLSIKHPTFFLLSPPPFCFQWCTLSPSPHVYRGILCVFFFPRISPYRRSRAPRLIVFSGFFNITFQKPFYFLCVFSFSFLCQTCWVTPGPRSISQHDSFSLLIVNTVTADHPPPPGPLLGMNTLSHSKKFYDKLSCPGPPPPEFFESSAFPGFFPLPPTSLITSPKGRGGFIFFFSLRFFPSVRIGFFFFLGP